MRRFPWWALALGVGVLLAAGGGAVLLTRLVKKFEGLSLTVYQDEAGYWTIGYGHLVRPGEPYHPYGPVREISEAQADALLAQDMATADSAVRRLVRVTLTENQREALVSFVFNIGETRFAASTLLRKLNTGDYAGAAAEFDRWVHAGGRRSNGLIARRAEERAAFEVA